MVRAFASVASHTNCLGLDKIVPGGDALSNDITVISVSLTEPEIPSDRFEFVSNGAVGRPPTITVIRFTSLKDYCRQASHQAPGRL